MKFNQESNKEKQETCQFCQAVERVEKIVIKYKLTKKDTKTLFGLLDNWDAAKTLFILKINLMELCRGIIKT